MLLPISLHVISLADSFAVYSSTDSCILGMYAALGALSRLPVSVATIRDRIVRNDSPKVVLSYFLVSVVCGHGKYRTLARFQMADDTGLYEVRDNTGRLP
jgi:hypothetical protein